MEYIKNIIEYYKQIRNFRMLHQTYKGKYAFVSIGSHSMNNLYPVLDYLHVPLKYICCKSTNKLSLIETAFPHIHATTSLDEILEDAEIKGVFVSASPNTHFSIASKVIEYNKALFIEKPPCQNTEELMRLVELQKQKDVLAVVDLQKRCTPAVQSLKRELSKCKGTMTYNLKYLTGAYPEGDSLINLFIHPLDVVVYLFGNAEVRYAENIGGHTLMLMLKHTNVTGILELSTGYTWTDAQECMTINTNRGIYTLENMDSLIFQQKPYSFCGVPLEKVFKHKKVTVELFGRNNFIPISQNNQVFTQGYYSAIKRFVDAVEGTEHSVPHSLHTCVSTYSLIDSINSFTKK